MRKFIDNWGAIIVGGIILMADRLTKEIVLLRDWPNIRNTGGVWGWGGVGGWIWISLVVIGLLIAYYLINKPSKSHKYATWLIIAGGLGNLYDRIKLGGVIDWLHPIGWFPWFNLADVSINLGVGLIIIYTFYAGHK